MTSAKGVKEKNKPNDEKFTVRTEAHRFMHFHSVVHVTFHGYFMCAFFRSSFSPVFFSRSGFCNDAEEKLFDSFFAHVVVSV